MKIQFFSKALKGNLIKAAFAAGSAGYFFSKDKGGVCGGGKKRYTILPVKWISGVTLFES